MVREVGRDDRKAEGGGGHLWDKREILEGPGVNFMECEFYIKKEKKS